MRLNGPFSKAQEQDVLQGVFCDVYGTLVNSSYEANMPLVLYLNALHEAGIRVTIFSSDPSGMRRKTQNIGLHYELAGLVQDKARYEHALLETLIDDDPPAYLQAKTRWDPKKPELYTHIAAEIKRLSTKPSGPQPL